MSRKHSAYYSKIPSSRMGTSITIASHKSTKAAIGYMRRWLSVNPGMWIEDREGRDITMSLLSAIVHEPSSERKMFLWATEETLRRQSVANFHTDKPLKKGDRVELIWEESRHANSVPPKTKGTVSDCDDNVIFVNWDSGQNAALFIPPDKVRKI